MSNTVTSSHTQTGKMSQLLDDGIRSAHTGSSGDDSLIEEGAHLLKLAAHAAAYTAIQQPLTAFAQLGNRLCGREILPELEIIEPLPKAEFGSKEWVAEMVGTGIGFYVDYLFVAGATSLALKGLSGAAVAAEELPLFARFVKPAELAVRNAPLATKFVLPTAKAALDGALYGAFLIPSASSSSQDFWSERRNNAVVCGVAFGAQSAIASAIVSKTAGASMPAIKTIFRSHMGENAVRLGSNVVSGIVAGAVDAEGTALLAGEGYAQTEAIAAQIVQYTLSPS